MRYKRRSQKLTPNPFEETHEDPDRGWFSQDKVNMSIDLANKSDIANFQTLYKQDLKTYLDNKSSFQMMAESDANIAGLIAHNFGADISPGNDYSIISQLDILDEIKLGKEISGTQMDQFVDFMHTLKSKSKHKEPYPMSIEIYIDY